VSHKIRDSRGGQSYMHFSFGCLMEKMIFCALYLFQFYLDFVFDYYHAHFSHVGVCLLFFRTRFLGDFYCCDCDYEHPHDCDYDCGYDCDYAFGVNHYDNPGCVFPMFYFDFYFGYDLFELFFCLFVARDLDHDWNCDDLG